MKSRSKNRKGYVTIFRRFRRTKGGRVLDAWQYGLKAWPIQVPADKLKS